MAWASRTSVIKRAIPVPAEPDEIAQLVTAFITATRRALADPEFSVAQLTDLLTGADYPLDIIVEHFPFDVFESLYPAALAAGQSQLSDTARRTIAPWPFDDLDPNVIFWTKSNAANLVSSLTDSQRHSLNSLLLRHTLDRSSVDQIAAELRQIIGLHPRYANAVTNFHQRLLDDGTHPAFASKQADLYRDRLIQARAWTIARTEVMKAQNMGQRIGWQQAMDTGNLPRGSLMKWVAAVGHPNPPCPICRQLHGSTVAVLDGRFQTSTRLASGIQRIHVADTPPQHPNCRCRLVLVQPATPRRLRIGPPAPFTIPQPPARPQYTVSKRRTTRSLTRSI
jgi:hypothetical protein